MFILICVFFCCYLHLARSMLIFAMSANHCSPLLPAASGRPCQLPFQHPFCSFSTEPQFQSWWQFVQADPCTGPSSSLSPTVRGPRSTAGLAPHRSQDSLRPLSLKGSEMTAAQGLSPGQHTCSAPHRALSIKHHPIHPVWVPNPSTPRTQAIVDTFLPHTGSAYFYSQKKKSTT